MVANLNASRNHQLKDTKILLNAIQSGKLDNPDTLNLIENFSKEYSSIAKERILNYHLSTTHDVRSSPFIF